MSVETDELRVTRQLTGGDGFQASNQRILTFGLGKDDVVRKINVVWPSRQVDEFSDVPANSRWTVIEGRRSLYSASDE